MRVKVKWSDACDTSSHVVTSMEWRSENVPSLDNLNEFFKDVFGQYKDYSTYKWPTSYLKPDVSFIEVNNYAYQLFYTYFLPYIYSHDDELYAFSYDEDDALDDETYVGKRVSNLFARIYLYLRETQEYYSPLLEAYETMKGKLYNEVVSKEGISLMPQSANMTELGGTSDDLSKAVIRKDDGGTAMQRLNEIQASYRSLYQEWADDMCERFSLWR